MEPVQDDPSLRAAQTAVLVMRAATPGAGATVRTVLSSLSLPSSSVGGNDAEIAAALARLPKPQVCTPGLRNDILSIRCEPVSREEAVVIRQAADQWLGAGIREFLEAGREPGADPQRVLVVAGGENLLITADVLESYFRGYVIEAPVSYGFRDRAPDEAERRRGVAVVMEVKTYPDNPRRRIVEDPEW